jgi:hypothetical protein
MNRGRLVPPNLDDRKWQDIVDQAKALIPTYAPQWTDHNPSDLGITLIELFAWMVEGLTYRLNRVPEKNYIEFLNLLGITRDPATPASTVLVYSALPNVLENMQVPKGSRVSTQPTKESSPIFFETDEKIDMWAHIKQALYIYSKKIEVIASPYPGPFPSGSPLSPVSSSLGDISGIGSGLNALTQERRYIAVSKNLICSPFSGFSVQIPPSIPPSILPWIRYAKKKTKIVFGFDFDQDAVDIQAKVIKLYFAFSKPAKPDEVELKWFYSAGNSNPSSWTEITDVLDETMAFQKEGCVSFQAPEVWSRQTPEIWDIKPSTPADKQTESLFWVAVQIVNKLTTKSIEIGFEHILFNFASATNALTTKEEEILGVSNGKPFQFFEFKHAPIFKRPNTDTPYDHVTIQVREPKPGAEGGFTDWATWQQRDDFAAGEGHYYRLDPVTGTLNFGNFDAATSPQGHGQIPPKGSEVKAVSYRYVAGGANGNVGPETLTHMVQDEQAPSGLRVTNPGAATGGSDEESIEDAKRRAPQLLRNRYRAVTAEDYEYLAQEASTDVAIVRCLPPRLHQRRHPTSDYWKKGDPWTFAGIDRSPGNVTVIIIPKHESGEKQGRPQPTVELINEVQQYLDQRRDLTANLFVTGPRYLPIKVKIDGVVWNNAVTNGLIASKEQVKKDIILRLEQFFHPIFGGVERNGWSVGQSIFVFDIYKAISLPDNIGYISNLQVAAKNPPLYHTEDFIKSRDRASTGERDDFVFGLSVVLTDYELVCFDNSEVAKGSINLEYG